MLRSDSLSTFHRIMFAIMGLTCLACVVLALLQVRPDPFPFWIPGILGIISAAPIFALAAAGRKNANTHLMKVTSWTNAAPRRMRFGLH